MNRILQAFFLISIAISPALGQDPDSVFNSSPANPLGNAQEPRSVPDSVLYSSPANPLGNSQEPRSVPDSVLYSSPANPLGNSQEPRRAVDTAQADLDRYFQYTDSLRHAVQADTVRAFADEDLRSADTLVVVEPDLSHSAYKAIMYALVLPGLGQGYNKKYYKIPIVYAALGGVAYAISYNTKNYKLWSYNYSLTPDATNERGLRYFRRNLELSYIGLILVYALQVLDAYVDAQLYNWDVNENLSLRVAPSLQPLMAPASVTGRAYGFTCSIDLKRK